MYTNEIKQWEGDTTQALKSFTWTSRKYILPARITFSAFRIIFTPGDMTAYNDLLITRAEAVKINSRILAEGTLFGGGEGFSITDYPISGDSLEDVPSEPSYTGDNTLTFTLYADGSSVFSKAVYESGIYRIGTGYRSRVWHFSLVGNIAVQRIDLATSASALKFEGQEG